MDDPKNPVDPRTRQTLDAIADLFLTDPLPSSTPGAAQDAASPQPARPESTSPYRLSPKLRASAAATVAATLNPARPIPGVPTGSAAGAGLPGAADGAPPGGAFRRWRQGSPSRTAVPDVAPPFQPRATSAWAVRSEAVFVGNLPGFGGPWLAQYAHQIAQRQGAAVAILHVDDDRIDLELLRPLSQRAPIIKPPSAGLLDVLANLCHNADAPARHWIIHLAMPLTPRAQAMARELDRWTILCGSDEAAIVSTYSWLKQMLEGDARRAQRRVGVAIMGSDTERATLALGKLRQAAGGFLQHGIELRSSQKQMGPVNLQNLGSFPDPEALWPQIVAMMQAMAEEEEVEAEPQTPAASYAFPAPSAPAAEPQLVEEPEPEVVVPTPARPTPARPPQTAPAPVASSVPEEAEATTVPAASSPDLAMFLTDVGSVALEARCPRQLATQILLDQTGRLHLLHRHISAPPSSGGAAAADPAGTLMAAVVDLLESRAWVRQHIELIALTQRQCRFDPNAEPVLHLFTDQAKLAVGLATRLGPALRLHLLQHVRIGGASTWVSTPLT